MDAFAKRDLKIDISNANATSPLKNLFVTSTSSSQRNGLEATPGGNPIVAICYVFLDMKPMTLKERLDSDQYFAHQDLRKNFKKSMTFVIKHFEALQLVDSGPNEDNRDACGS